MRCVGSKAFIVWILALKMQTVLDSYKRLQQKFGLPHLEKLQSAFQFEIDDEADLDDIRNEISGKLFDFSERVIEPLLWSVHYRHIIERNMLAAHETRSLFELYKQIQAFRWRNNLLLLRPDEDATARLILDLWIFWKRFGDVAGEVCVKFSKGWANLNFKETVAEYHD